MKEPWLRRYNLRLVDDAWDLVERCNRGYIPASLISGWMFGGRCSPVSSARRVLNAKVVALAMLIVVMSITTLLFFGNVVVLGYELSELTNVYLWGIIAPLPSLCVLLCPGLVPGLREDVHNAKAFLEVLALLSTHRIETMLREERAAFSETLRRRYQSCTVRIEDAKTDDDARVWNRLLGADVEKLAEAFSIDLK